RLLASDASPSSEDAGPPFARIDEPVWLEPMPNSWLARVEPDDPHAPFALKESVALAFVAALQCLSAVQRAALLGADLLATFPKLIAYTDLHTSRDAFPGELYPAAA
ncbi:MAG: RNA polymerase subunit sigma-24, partial [Myxococcota bacterium]|nr:RNA polymerase subunit sigma-24 [Myxococcota bacterium]